MVADDLLPQVSWPGPESQKPVVQGKLRTVRTAGRFAKPTRKHLLRLHFFQNLEVACTCISAEETPTGTVLKRDHARFTALGCDFPVARTDGELIVEVQSDEPFAPSFETRIIETLQFVLARSLALRIMVIAEDAAQGLELASAVPTVGKAKLDPPLAAGYQGFQECFWPLFIRYLEYVVANNNTQYWHSCSYHLNNACEASAHSIDAWATAVCVAVEGISSLVTFEQTAEDEQVKKDVIKAVSQFVDSQGWDQRLTDRIKGLVGQLNNVRVIDRLARLRDGGHINETHRKAWSDLRNRQAHPRHLDSRNINMADIQNMLDMVAKTTLLMYHIVFYLIGYSGKYVDYGTPGYPARDYPLPAPKEPEGKKGSASPFRALLCKLAVWVKNSLRVDPFFTSPIQDFLVRRDSAQPQ